ncbi:MAG TPA: extensin family protein, partial [Pseudolabrys sp.]
VQSAPIQNGNMRWTPGPPGIEQPQAAPPAQYAPPAARYSPSYEPTEPPAAAGRPMSIYPPGVAQPDDIPEDAVLPPGRARPDYLRTQPAYNAPVYQPPQQRTVPPLGPMRGPNATTAVMPAALTPPATLACPLVSALDRWVTEGVQPAAMRWFGSPVAEIKQISAYSCREMVGAGTSHISEHAFGNALDVAGFVLADGRKITVQDGWHGSPEEQGFLHDVQLYACETFTTVLSPGYNVYHYNHIHVDLMRRESGRHPCRPDAIPGEVAAAKARSMYAAKQRGPAYTGSIVTKARDKEPIAVPGEDGYVAGDEDDVTGSIGGPRSLKHGVDHEFDLTDETPASPRHSSSTASAGDAAIRAEERNSAFH